MKLNRMFEIVHLLTEKKSVTASELADRFEVSERTIYRDIETLSESGIPVYAIRGNGGGISITDSFVMNKSVLTRNERDQIIYALKSIKATGIEGTDDVLRKFNAMLNSSSDDWIEIDFSRWGSGGSDNKKFEVIKSAILEHCMVEFEYVSSYGERTVRKVNPLKLLYRSRSWYLWGYDSLKSDYRLFRVSRIIDLKKNETKFDREEFNMSDTLTDPVNSYSSTDFEFIVTKDKAFRVYDEFDESAINTDDEGNVFVKVSIPADDWIYSFFSSLGESLKIIKPKRMNTEE